MLKMTDLLRLSWVLILACISTISLTARSENIRVGIIGLDTSHAVAFTRLLNDSSNPGHVPGATVVAAYPGGSDDIPQSYERLPRFRAALETEFAVAIADSIPALLSQVDAVLLLSVDGRKHLEQARPVFESGKRLYIDKPLAGTLADARAIVRLSQESGTPFFSASSLRFAPAVQALLDEATYGRILGADAYSPAELEEHHPDLYWYGIHGVETLYTVMGPGCDRVLRAFNPEGEVVVGIWNDGRIGTFRGIRQGAHDYGVRIIGEKQVGHSAPIEGNIYRGLVEAIVRFFQTGQAPVDPLETLEIFEFMSAAQLSRERNGAVVSLGDDR